jgi:hypothetical protein
MRGRNLVVIDGDDAVRVEHGPDLDPGMAQQLGDLLDGERSELFAAADTHPGGDRVVGQVDDQGGFG